MSDVVQNWAVKLLSQDPDLELDIVDLKEVNLPFYDEPITPSMAHGQFSNPIGTAWAKRVASAEAFLMITPEYNYGTSAVLKNALDWVYEGWNNKPVGFIGYGGMSGGIRAVQQLRQNIGNLKLFSTSSAVAIPGVHHAFDESGQPIHSGLNDNLLTVIDELKDLQKRLASNR